ncbi:unnamed protein product [Peronospora belbahrii]|nr:unnamed protein product [Peronospora belbahrii]
MRSVENDIDKFTERHKRKRAEISQSRRREQCRANQARYRDKQRNAQMTLEKSVEQLHQELDVLKCKYRDLSSHGRSNQSPWSIAAEFFQLVETSFRSPWIMSSTHEMEKYTETRQLVTILERAFAKDVALGELRRADALMEQLRLYSHYFGEPDLQLQRIESMAPHVTAAHGILSVTVTEITLQHVFSHVKKPASGDQTEVSPRQLYQRLLGQRLECSCLVIFLFNKASDHVVRLVATIDLIPALLRVLGNLRDVSKVFEHAQVSLESVIGRFDPVRDSHSNGKFTS